MMTRKMRPFLIAFLLGVIVPGVLLSICEKLLRKDTNDGMSQTTPADNSEDLSITVTVLMKDGNIQLMEMNDYLTAVILREMPATFEFEALKAQAVVARTYLLRRWEGGSGHNNADICTDSACCQAYWDINAYLSEGGTAKNVEKVQKAVSDTVDEVLIYNGNLIDATYFACSGGMTEDAAAVWGSDVPYLRAVESPGEEAAKHYVDTVTFTTEEFLQNLGIESKSKMLDIKDIQYTAGGGLDTVNVCGVTLKGTMIRKELGLNSTSMQIEVIGDTVYITTKGKGHRVGMSQYGADAMAKKGADYREILFHYYNGADVVKYMAD